MRMLFTGAYAFHRCACSSPVHMLFTGVYALQRCTYSSPVMGTFFTGDAHALHRWCIIHTPDHRHPENPQHLQRHQGDGPVHVRNKPPCPDLHALRTTVLRKILGTPTESRQRSSSRSKRISLLVSLPYHGKSRVFAGEALGPNYHSLLVLKRKPQPSNKPPPLSPYPPKPTSQAQIPT